MNLKELKDEADIRAAELGHAWSAWNDDEDGMSATTKCKYCSAQASVGSSGIVGYAVEAPCPGRCTHPEKAISTYIDQETGDTVRMCLWCGKPVDPPTIKPLTKEDLEDYKGPGVHIDLGD